MSAPASGCITLVLATDSPLMGDGLAALLAATPDVKVLGRARNLVELLDLVAKHHPEAVVFSIRTQVSDRMATIETARKLRADHPELGIVVISDRGNGFALELLRGGASRVAYLLDGELPSIASVLSALRDVRSGQTVLDPTIVDALVRRRDGYAIDDLTVREMDVLEQLAHGLSNRAMAADLHVSVKSIENNVSVIFRKLGLDDPTVIDRRVTAGLIYQRAQTTAFPPLPAHLQASTTPPTV